MRGTPKTETITTGDLDLDFATAKRLADATAARALDGPICLSWYDRAADRESPAHASECHGDCEIPGYVEYAVTRGAELRIVVDGGAFVFCYVPSARDGAATAGREDRPRVARVVPIRAYSAHRSPTSWARSGTSSRRITTTRNPGAARPGRRTMTGDHSPTARERRTGSALALLALRK